MKSWIVYTFFGVLFYGIAEYFSKIFAEYGTKTSIGLSIGFYTLTTLCWFPCLRNNNQLVIMTLIWTLAYGIIGAGIGFIGFHETVTKSQAIGLILAFISIILMTR